METTILDDSQATKPVVYAGFWLRLAALLIDGLILMIPIAALQWFLMGDYFSNPTAIQDDMNGYLASLGQVSILSIVIYWLYFALQEASEKQATLGKRAVNIKVTNMEGERITFLNATGRYFGKILSGIILYIGYIMAAFTEKRQALHDILAKTLVVRG